MQNYHQLEEGLLGLNLQVYVYYSMNLSLHASKASCFLLMFTTAQVHEELITLTTLYKWMYMSGCGQIGVL
jgi:hypothetical protein